MIIEYNSKYNEEIKDLLVELQEHIVNIDKLKYNIITDKYREDYFKETMNEVTKYQGKIYLYQEDNRIIALIIGLINNEEEHQSGFTCPKRGRITELVVSKNTRSKGIGTLLLNKMTEYLKNENCKDILIGVFGYNEQAIKFYEKNGYHTRMIEMTKKIEED